MHAGLKLKHACYVAAIKSARLARLMMLKRCLVKMPKNLFLCILLKSKSLPLTLQYLTFPFLRTSDIYFTECFYITDKVDEIVPVSKPSRIADNATVDSRVATIKQRPSSRCFPSATDMNVSGSHEALLYSC